MKKIIDANYFSDPALEKYLRSDNRNKVIFNDYACMEAYKGNAVTNIFKSIEIVSKYPKQVIVLKGTGEIVSYIKPSLKGLQKLLEDPNQTKEFNIFCNYVKKAALGNKELTKQIISRGKAASKHFNKLRDDTKLIIESIERYKDDLDQAQIYELKDEPRELRKKINISDDLFDKMMRDILYLTAFYFKKHPDFEEAPPVNMLRSSYIFRFAICGYLLMLRWIADGGADSVSQDRMLNDSVDMNYAAYATYFDGLLTKDKKMKSIYNDACFLLKEMFK